MTGRSLCMSRSPSPLPPLGQGPFAPGKSPPFQEDAAQTGAVLAWYYRFFMVSPLRAACSETREVRRCCGQTRVFLWPSVLPKKSEQNAPKCPFSCNPPASRHEAERWAHPEPPRKHPSPAPALPPAAPYPVAARKGCKPFHRHGGTVAPSWDSAAFQPSRGQKERQQSGGVHGIPLHDTEYTK